MVPPVVVVDSDSDGISDNIDNCDDVPNQDQADEDVDGIGDVCDPFNNNITPPAAPLSIFAVPSFSDLCNINVQWMDGSDNEDSFVLVRHFDTQSSSGLTYTRTVAAVSGSGSSVFYTDILYPGIETVSYTVKAINAGGESATISSQTVSSLCN